MLTLAETPHALLQAMSASLATLQDPRARHWLLLPGRGRAETLLHQWARLAGIAAHSQELELRVLIEQAGAGPQRQRFDFERLRLAIASALPGFSTHPLFPIPPSQPLSPITTSVLDWATILAKAIDDGMLCRPPGERWSPDSFLCALADHASVAESLETHVGSLTSPLFEQSTRAWLENWSQRGGVPHLWIQLDEGIPALQFERLLQFIQILSENYRSRLHLFALSPSAEYWAEAKLRGAQSSPQEGDLELHPGGLLWALGRCSQDLHRQLAGTFLAEGEGGHTLESAPLPDSLLGRLQLACRRSAPLPPEELRPHSPEDASLTVHSTRSTLRELEVCRDRILQARAEMPDLRYEEVLLLLADPQRQAPFVESALRTDDPRHTTLPFRLLGFGQSVPSPFAESLTLLLQTIRSRLDLTDIQALIETPLLAVKFGFQEALDNGQNLLQWLRDAQFRWGLNTVHRSEFQDIREPRWNLFWALQRLGLGAIVSRESRDAILQLPDNSGESVALERASGLSLTGLARLASFAKALETARTFWTQPLPRPVPDWNKQLVHLVDTFLDHSSIADTQHYTKLLSILPQLEKAAKSSQAQLTPEAYIRLLTEKLASLSESGVRGGGGICVADLRQYAGVPARLTLITGLDDGTFPRRDDRPAWHPLAGTHQPGDPQLRDKDRHALLLAILACRERLVLSYQGGSDEDSKERPPSTALADLLQAIDQGSLPSQNDKAPHHDILFTHPLNGFSAGAFLENQSPSGRSYLRNDFVAAETILNRNGLPPFAGPWKHPLPATEPFSRQLRLGSLRTLLQDPSRIFLTRMGLRLPEEQEELDGGDLLQPDNLHRWAIRDRALHARLEGTDTETLFRHLHAAGHIPRGQIGREFWIKTLSETPSPTEAFSAGERVTQTLRVTLPHPFCSEFEWTVEGQLKSGWYRQNSSEKAHFFSASILSLKHKLAFCLDALMLVGCSDSTANSAPILEVDALFRNEQTPLALRFESSQQARELLQKLLPLLELAEQLPLPFWPGTAEAILMETFEGKIPIPCPTPQQINSALEVAFQKWTESSFGDVPPDSESPATRYTFRGCPNPFTMDVGIPEEIPWLPDPHEPLAWRLVSFLHHWSRNVGLK